MGETGVVGVVQQKCRLVGGIETPSLITLLSGLKSLKRKAARCKRFVKVDPLGVIIS